MKSPLSRRPRGPRDLRLGIDLGRTWLRACLADGTGRVLKRCRVPAVPWPRLPEALRQLRRRLAFRRLERLSIGAAGLGAAADRAQARRLLRGQARRVTTASDAHWAHLAAFAGGPGILVLSGTGSIALARDGRGKPRRAGGWGQLLGDAGSGFWIGRRALHDATLRAALRVDPLALARSAEPIRAVAALAPRVLWMARRGAGGKGVRPARRIRAEAAQRLAALAAEAGKGLHWDREVPVSWWGGVFADAPLRARFLAALRRTLPRARARAPLMTAAEAAALLEAETEH